MKEYAVSGLMKEVKVILDRNQETAELIPDDTDTLSQGEIIKGVIVDAAKAIEELAPTGKLDEISVSGLAVAWTEDGGSYVGQLSLPSDLLRLVRVKVSDWKRSGAIITDKDDSYQYQQNPYVRGNPQRPIVALVHIGGVLVAELYTSNKKDATADLSYVAMPSIGSDDKISLCEPLKDAIVYMAAYLTSISLGDTETAARYKETAYQLAGIVEPSQT